VETIDGFFTRLATVAALELGLSPDWRMIEETELDQRQASIVTCWNSSTCSIPEAGDGECMR
jgi:hypothetical protein